MVNTSGNTVLYSMLGLLSFNILIAIICSGSMSFLFPLFNMIQLITLIPLLQLDLPENLRSFIGHYLQFANLKFDILFNPFHRWNIIDLTEVLNNPLNDNFEKNDLKSRALIVNYGGQLILWTVVIFLYIPITIIAKCCKIRKFQELKNYYEFAVLLTSFSEAFVEFTLLAFLNSFQVYIYIYIIFLLDGISFTCNLFLLNNRYYRDVTFEYIYCDCTEYNFQTREEFSRREHDKEIRCALYRHKLQKA